MANIRQYIGARYTIKVYENSQDAGSAEWEANTSYEPLVMVTYNNSSYLSKKDVPATIGNPAQNPIYWIVTGAYNGQILNLQNQIDAIVNEIGDANSGIIKDIDDMQTSISNLSLPKSFKHKKVVWIGDSYGDGANEHPELIQNAVGFDEFYNLSTGSTGFTGKEGSADQNVALEWKTILTNWVNNQSSETLNGITDVYISGGFNDVYSTSISTIRSYISAFMTYAKSVLPNAHFYLVFCGWCGGPSGGDVTTPTETAAAASFRYRLANKVMIAYSQSELYGMTYLGNAINALHNYRICFEADKYHPSATGQERLARQILNLMMGGSDIPYTSITDGGENQVFTISTMYGVSPYYTLFDYASYDGSDLVCDYNYISRDGIPYTFAADLAARTPLSIGTWYSPFIAPVLDGVDRTGYAIPILIQTTSKAIAGELLVFQGGTLQLVSYEPITNGTTCNIIARGSFVRKIWDC